MSRQRLTTASTFKDHPIKTDDGPCILNILEGFYDRLHYMVNHYKQVSVMHIVVTFPDHITDMEANEILSKSLESLRKTMKNNNIDSQIGWVHEHAVHDDGPITRSHFHIGIIADGSKTQSAVTHTEHLNNLISKHMSNTCTYAKYIQPECDKQNLHQVENATAIKIRQDKPHADAQFSNAFNWLSYHAKCYQKGHACKYLREYGFTRLPSDN